MNSRYLSFIALLAATAGAAQAQQADQDGLTVTLGVERSRTSLTGGSTDKPEVSPLLGLDYRNGRFFASTQQGIGYEVVKTDGLTVFAAGGFLPGRKESKAGDKKDNPRLVGMGKVKASGLLAIGAAVSPFGEVVQLSGTVLKSTDSKQGLTAVFGAGTGFPIWGPVSASVSVGATYADRKHAQTFYGVTAAQSVRSGNPVFTPRLDL
jgi:outer membrane protein